MAISHAVPIPQDLYEAPVLVDAAELAGAAKPCGVCITGGGAIDLE